MTRQNSDSYPPLCLKPYEINLAIDIPDPDHLSPCLPELAAEAQARATRFMEARHQRNRKLRRALQAIYRLALHTYGDIGELEQLARDEGVYAGATADAFELAIRLAFVRQPLDRRRRGEYVATLRCLHHLGIQITNVRKFLRACSPSSCARAAGVLAVHQRMGGRVSRAGRTA